MRQTPPFDEALTSFLEFAGAEKFSINLAWVFREDVVGTLLKCWVRVPLPAANAALARAYFEYGRQQGRGVTLEVLCRLGDRSVCFVWVPEDEAAASHAMQRPLKLMFPTHPVEASAIESEPEWELMCRFYGSYPDANMTTLPMRSEAERFTGWCVGE